MKIAFRPHPLIFQSTHFHGWPHSHVSCRALGSVVCVSFAVLLACVHVDHARCRTPLGPALETALALIRITVTQGLAALIRSRPQHAPAAFLCGSVSISNCDVELCLERLDPGRDCPDDAAIREPAVTIPGEAAIPLTGAISFEGIRTRRAGTLDPLALVRISSHVDHAADQLFIKMSHNRPSLRVTRPSSSAARLHHLCHSSCRLLTCLCSPRHCHANWPHFSEKHGILLCVLAYRIVLLFALMACVQVEYGFMTMTATRRLVLLLPSDPLIQSAPLVGVYVVVLTFMDRVLTVPLQLDSGHHCTRGLQAHCTVPLFRVWTTHMRACLCR